MIEKRAASIAARIAKASPSIIEAVVRQSINSLVSEGFDIVEAREHLSRALIKEGQINISTTTNVNKALKILGEG